MPNAIRRPRRLQAHPSFSARLALHESARPMLARTLAEIPREFKSDALTAAYDAWLEGTAATTMREGIATIPVRNVLTKDWSWWNYYLGWSSYDQIAHDLEVALADREVRGIILSIDSPGGMVDGCAELATRLMAARGSGKPIIAHIDGLGASAAYWIASAASRVVLSPTAMVGSIGVVMSFTDWSKYEEALGIRTIEIVSTQSPNKRPDPAEEAGRSQLQVHVDAMARVFIEAVAQQRDVSVEVVSKEFGMGDVFVGSLAVTAGLADSLGTYEATHRALVESTLTHRGDPEQGLAHIAARLALEFPPAAPAAAPTSQEDSMAGKTPATRPAAADPVEDDENPTPPEDEKAPEAAGNDEEKDEQDGADAEDPPVDDEEKKDDEEDSAVAALEKSHGAVLARVRSAAAAAERKRIAGIRALGHAGQGAVVQACIDDASCSVEAAALRLLTHDKNKRAAHLRGVQAENESLPKPDNRAAPEGSSDASIAGSISALYHEHNPKRRPSAAGRA